MFSAWKQEEHHSAQKEMKFFFDQNASFLLACLLRRTMSTSSFVPSSCPMLLSLSTVNRWRAESETKADILGNWENYKRRVPLFSRCLRSSNSVAILSRTHSSYKDLREIFERKTRRLGTFVLRPERQEFSPWKVSVMRRHFPLLVLQLLARFISFFRAFIKRTRCPRGLFTPSQSQCLPPCSFDGPPAGISKSNHGTCPLRIMCADSRWFGQSAEDERFHFEGCLRDTFTLDLTRPSLWSENSWRYLGG